MSKIKIPKKSPSIDMTPMVDLAFLLVTFFMLTSQFRAPESVVVDLPSSISEIKVPERNVISIIIDNHNKVYFNVDGKQVRQQVVSDMARKYGVKLSDEQINAFTNLNSFGVPIQSLAQWIDMGETEREEFESPGIPYDSLNNQLYDWIIFSRFANRSARFALKGDAQSDYAAAQAVIKILEKCKVFKFNFITNFEQPENIILTE